MRILELFQAAKRSLLYRGGYGDGMVYRLED